MRRLESGQPLRDAMKAAGMGIPALAAKTKEIDPEGHGLSGSYVGFIVGAGKTSRDECSDRAAQLIAAALDQEVGALFETVVYVLDESTSTRRTHVTLSRNRGRAVPEHLMTQKELAAYLRKSMSWIDRQVQEAKARGEIWPGLFYVGESRRFDPAEVLASQQIQHATA
ncbi:hypothetical protein ACWF94_26080 [Streptomyces sp. NPDC055078]